MDNEMAFNQFLDLSLYLTLAVAMLYIFYKIVVVLYEVHEEVKEAEENGIINEV